MVERGLKQAARILRVSHPHRTRTTGVVMVLTLRQVIAYTAPLAVMLAAIGALVVVL
jgi:hypothetical protein